MMKEIKINEKNFDKITTAINAVQGSRCEVRIIDAMDIINMAFEAEKHLEKYLPLKADRVGACYYGGNHGKFPKAYKYTPMGTTYVIRRGSTAWYLTAVSRECCRGDNFYRYTEHQQKIISRNAVSKAQSIY